MELSKKNLLSLIEKNQINDCKIINLNIFGNELLIDILTSNPTLQSKKSIENSIKKIISENIQEKLDLKINFKIEKVENPQNQIKGNPIEGIKNVIAIASGKGGVGKSTVTSNIAITLTKMGFNVGILDADIYGPSIPIMFDIADARPLSINIEGKNKMKPIESYGVKILSIGFFTFISSYTALSLINKFYPLRVSPVQEELGLNIAEHNAVSIEHDLISILDKQSESGDLKIRGPQDPFTAGGVIGLYYNKLMSILETSEEEKNKWRERISKEVKLAVKVQENFLPKRNLKNYPVHGINISAREVSGDFFSFYPHNNSIYFIIADVAGKGIHAGMVMAKASKVFEVLSQS